jgi:lipid A 3-O-deacylase
MRSIILILTLCSSFSSIAQEINNYSTLFDLRDSSFVRISYDNDLLAFRGTDDYYTQGIGIDVYSYRLRKNPLNKLLFSLKNSDRDRFGIEFRTHGCTPTSILSDSVLIGDRPFAGVFSFGITRNSHQNERRLRLTTKFELGMIGPAALGEQTQRGIHSITGDDIPLGWQHQIQNSPIINYMVRLELGTGLFVPRYFYSSVYGETKIGTFQTNLSSGAEFSIGPRNTSYSEEKHTYEFYLFGRSGVSVVGYDASLMGGIINRDGYFLSYAEIHPVVLRVQAGCVFAAPHFSIATQIAFLSKEIRTGSNHFWGGLRLTFY